MSELPARPNIDQLRRQARELLRAAAGGEPAALTRIRAFSGRVSLSAAQLAVAREYGFASWPALHAEVERRIAELPVSGGQAEISWSFGGAFPVKTVAGTLYPGGLAASPGHATLDASLVPSAVARHRLTVPLTDSDAREARANAMVSLTEAMISAIALTDDQGTRYALHAEEISGGPEHHDPGRGPISLRLKVDPVPARDQGWLELRGQGGSAARLEPSGHPHARVSRPVPVPGNPVARELSEHALGLIGLQLTGAGRDEVDRQCSAVLARAAEIRQSGGPGTAGDLPGQLARLCAVLTGDSPGDDSSGDRLPRGWSSMIDAADRTDGVPQQFDLCVAFPQVDSTLVRVDSIVSEPGVWRMRLRAIPGWWIYDAGRRRKSPVMSVTAEDDLGGMYLSQFDSSRGHDGHEELALRFLPRLNPLARTLTLTFSGAREQVTLELTLPRPQ